VLRLAAHAICNLSFTYSSKLKDSEVHPSNSAQEDARRGV
jgi:hypothetical protein